MQTLTLPTFAQDHIKTLQSEIQTRQALLQAFVDGVVCGMGADMQAKINVNLETFVVTVDIGEGADALPELDLSQVDFSKAELCKPE